MSELLVTAIWFFLPAGLANVSPIIAAKLPVLNKYEFPLDFGIYVRGKRLFGANKTWRGLITGVLISIVASFTQLLLIEQHQSIKNIVLINYDAINPFILGFLLGTGAIIGDAIESMFKRQANIQPGRPWIPFDQTDYIIGACLLSYAYFPLTVELYLTILIFWSLIHPISSVIGYLTGFKNDLL